MRLAIDFVTEPGYGGLVWWYPARWMFYTGGSDYNLYIFFLNTLRQGKPVTIPVTSGLFSRYSITIKVY
jgi:hypothetical protein